MPRPFERYDDLALAVLRRTVRPRPQPPIASYRDLRAEVVIELESWPRMVRSMLAQLAEDAGDRKRALFLLDCGQAEIAAWLESPLAGMRELVARAPTRDGQGSAWLRRREGLRGEDFADLVASVRSFRLRGSGELDGARLRAEYRVRLRPKWGAMVVDLLAQVVTDASSLEYAATVLEQPLDRVWTWVLALVSRGNVEAARSTWPAARMGPLRGELPYSDLAEVVERGALERGPKLGQLPGSAARMREFYAVQLAPWPVMEAELLAAITADAGSIRKASAVIKMPRSTLSAKLRRQRGGASTSER